MFESETLMTIGWIVTAVVVLVHTPVIIMATNAQDWLLMPILRKLIPVYRKLFSIKTKPARVATIIVVAISAVIAFTAYLSIIMKKVPLKHLIPFNRRKYAQSPEFRDFCLETMIGFKDPDSPYHPIYEVQSVA